MNDLPENELLSAYLDGELTAAEQAEVESLLKRSARARRTLDELRALSATLQALPSQRLGQDLSAEVLRLVAERAQAGQAVAVAVEPEAGGPEDRSAEPPRPAVRRRAVETAGAVARRLIHSRALVWSGLAVAIAVMIAIREQPRESGPSPRGGVAMAPDAAPATPRPREPGWEPPSMRAIDDSKDDLRLEAECLDEPASDAAAGMPLLAGKGAESKGAEPSMAFQAGPDRSSGLPGQSLAEAQVAEAEVVAKVGEKLKEGPGGSPAYRYGAQKGQSLEDRPEQLARAALPAEYLLVHCEITPEAAAAGAFERVLAENRIVWDGEHRDGDGRFDRRDRGGLDVVNGAMRAVGGRDLADPADTAQAPSPDAEKPADELAPSTWGIDLVMVEAAPEQIESALRQLSADTGQFLSVSVQPAPGVESQRKFEQYDRHEGKAVAVDRLPVGQAAQPATETPLGRARRIAPIEQQRESGDERLARRFGRPGEPDGSRAQMLRGVEPPAAPPAAPMAAPPAAPMPGGSPTLDAARQFEQREEDFAPPEPPAVATARPEPATPAEPTAPVEPAAPAGPAALGGATALAPPAATAESMVRAPGYGGGRADGLAAPAEAAASPEMLPPSPRAESADPLAQPYMPAAPAFDEAPQQAARPSPAPRDRPTYRVLFVLRVASPETVAGEAARRAGREADVGQAAQPPSAAADAMAAPPDAPAESPIPPSNR